MKVQKKLICLLTGATGVLSLAGPTLAGQTGNFNGPLTTNLLASVDLNGGLSTDAKPTQGYNGSTATPLFGPDQYGVTWSPWGGGNSTFGDGSVWPQSNGGPQAGTASTAASAPAGLTNNVSYFSKTFGTVTIAVSAPGTSTNYGATPIDSRDRASSGPSYTYSAATNNTAALDGDMFRDLIFAPVSGSNVQGTNFLQVQFSGLTAGQQYQVALYSYDNAAARTSNWTATAPSNGGYSNAGGFAAPADEQTITWTAGAATPPAPALFTLTANANGTASVFGFGGSGTTGDSSSSSTYLNGIQISAVAAAPEPSQFAAFGLGLLGLGGLALRARRRVARA